MKHKLFNYISDYRIVVLIKLLLLILALLLFLYGAAAPLCEPASICGG